jgi:hypothetical protein
MVAMEVASDGEGVKFDMVAIGTGRRKKKAGISYETRLVRTIYESVNRG